MKTIKSILILFVVTALCGITITAEATLYQPLTSDQFKTIVENEPLYGPPPAASFPDGPTSILNGGTQNLIAGPGPGQYQKIDSAAVPVDYLLFVISFDPLLSEVSSGSVEFSLTTNSITESETLNYNGDNDFFTTAEAGFPSNIEGIGRGEVGGVKFPDAVHAGVIYDPFSGGSTGDDNGIVNIISPIWPLRVDIFSIDDFNFTPNPGFEGTIIGNTPNSHALAVVPEPATMFLLGSGLIGFAVAGRKKFFKK